MTIENDLKNLTEAINQNREAIEHLNGFIAGYIDRQIKAEISKQVPHKTEKEEITVAKVKKEKVKKEKVEKDEDDVFGEDEDDVFGEDGDDVFGEESVRQVDVALEEVKRLAHELVKEYGKAAIQDLIKSCGADKMGNMSQVQLNDFFGKLNELSQDKE